MAGKNPRFEKHQVPRAELLSEILRPSFDWEAVDRGTSTPSRFL
jgi:hypothetical protein